MLNKKSLIIFIIIIVIIYIKYNNYDEQFGALTQLYAKGPQDMYLTGNSYILPYNPIYPYYGYYGYFRSPYNRSPYNRSPYFRSPYFRSPYFRSSYLWNEPTRYRRNYLPQNLFY